MVLNREKTKIMLITTKQRRIHLNIEELSLNYNDEQLNIISGDKILDVYVDNNLAFSGHIDNTAKKITSNIWLLSKIKRFLSVEHRVQFYKTYILPHLDYCNIVWGCTSQTNLQRLFRLQKRACRIILDYNVTNISESMESLKILTIYERLFLRKAKFMYKVSNSLTPVYINNLFNQRSHSETVPVLRSVTSNYYIPPKPNKEVFKQSMSYSGPLIWNSLPYDLKTVETINSFHLSCIKWIKGSETQTNNS